MSGSDADIQWFIARDGKQHGPVSDFELKKIIELGHLKPGDLVWRQGFTDWRTAASVFPQFAGSNGPPPPEQQATSKTAEKKAAAAAASEPGSQPAAHGTTSQQQPTLGAWHPHAHATEAGNAPKHPSEAAARMEHAVSPPSAAGPAAAGNASAAAAAARTPLAADNRKTVERAGAAQRSFPAFTRGRRLALVATGLLAMTGIGAWLSSQYTDEVFSYLLFDDSTDAETATASLIPQPEHPQAAASIETAATTAPVSSTESIDRSLQGRTMWVAVKQEFPDWYQARVSEVARLSAQSAEPDEITRYLIGELVTLRRENAQHALAASTARHKQLATAFLANLKRLSEESGDGCYDFISKGESSPTIVARLDDPAKSTEIEAQVVAIVGAIVEGRSHPAEHQAPIKTDYDVLAGELGRLGWTQADMQLFADPKALAQAPRSRVCSMLKDWFTAHLAIEDPNTQERLLFETLKPVISG